MITQFTKDSEVPMKTRRSRTEESQEPDKERTVPANSGLAVQNGVLAVKMSLWKMRRLYALLVSLSRQQISAT